MISRRARGYRIADDGTLTDTTHWTLGLGADGGIVSDAPDEARFLTARVPIAAFALVGYLTRLAGSAIRGELARLGRALVALTAFGFSTYLLFVQLVAIGALCDWRLASDAVTTAVVGLALLRLRVGVA